MLKASITAEDAFTASVEVLEINKEGVRCKIIDASMCYKRTHVANNEQFFAWKDHNWAIWNIREESPVSNPIIYNLIVLLSKERGQDLENPDFVKYILDNTGISSQKYCDCIHNKIDEKPFSLYSDVCDALTKDDENLFGYRGSLLATIALGKYIRYLDESREARNSGSAKRKFFALTEKECLVEAVRQAQKIIG